MGVQQSSYLDVPPTDNDPSRQPEQLESERGTAMRERAAMRNRHISSPGAKGGWFRITTRMLFFGALVTVLSYAVGLFVGSGIPLG